MTRRNVLSLLPALALPSSLFATIPAKKGKLTLPGMKTIGILGGIGPQATMDLEAHLHRAAQQLIPQVQNTGYPPMLVHYYRHAPVMLKDDHTPIFPLQPDERLLQAAKTLGAVVDFILLSSNGVHMFQDQIQEAAGCGILSMIDATIEEIKRRKWRKVGVACYIQSTIYTARLEAEGIHWETINAHLQQQLDHSVMLTMEGRNGLEESKIAKEIIKTLRSKRVDGIIPGCTELPLLLGSEMNSEDIVNPSRLVAEAAIRYAISDRYMSCDQVITSFTDATHFPH